MVKQRAKKRHSVLSNVLAGAAYLVLMGQWALLLIFYLPHFFESSVGTAIFPQNNPPPDLHPSATAAQPPSTIIIVLGVVASLLLIGFIVYTVITSYVPAVARTGSVVTHAAVRRVEPMVMHQPIEKVPAHRRKQLSARILLWVQIALAVIPVAIMLVVYSRRQTLLLQLVVLLEAAAAIIVVVVFSIHRAVVQYWRLKPEQSL